jgi:L-aminopeptidase/D-esterase-like protein
MKGLTDIPGIRVGHASDYDALTGCTVILCDGGAVAGADIRGSASGTEEFPVMEPGHIVDRIHAVCLAGGSAFGLEAASGVRRFLEQKGVGFETGAAKVPLVPAAIVYDLGIGKAGVRPTREMGETAAAAATSAAVAEGSIGAGTGATVGKINGMRQAMKGGVGSATVEVPAYPGVLVAALAVTNAFGDIVDPRTGQIVAGARRGRDSSEFAGTEQVMKTRRGGGGFPVRNTTLVVVATNAGLNKVRAQKVAQLAQAGVARAVRPAHTMSDGDVAIALSLGKETADVNAVSIAAAEAVAEAILRSVRLAKSLGGVPGLAG